MSYRSYLPGDPTWRDGSYHDDCARCELSTLAGGEPGPCEFHRAIDLPELSRILARDDERVRRELERMGEL